MTSASSARPAAAPDPALARVRGILLDVDGTLYDQRPVRLAMLRRLLRFAAGSPVAGTRVLRALRAYRHAQERLRLAPPADAAVVDVAAAQLADAAARSGVPEAEVRAAVARWMDAEPLDLLARHARPGLAAFVRVAAERGVPGGVVSDYPAAAKLRALGIADLVRCVVCAQDGDVGCFKPHPRGLLAGARHLGVAPPDVLYVGDREGVDGAAARAAGMPYRIVGPEARAAGGPVDFVALQRVVFGG